MEVVGRKRGRQKGAVTTPATVSPARSITAKAGAGKGGGGKGDAPAKIAAKSAVKPAQPPKEKPKPGLRPPRSAAVTVTVLAEGDTTLAEAMAEARRAINLRDFGIETVRVKRAVTRDLLLEVPGEDGAAGGQVR